MTRLLERVSGLGEMRHAHKISVVNLKKNPFGGLGVNGKIILQDR
jgi:hypothetical protein